MTIEKLSIIEFDDRPSTSFEIASEQLEHLYIHMGLAQEKLNELIEEYNKHIHYAREMQYPTSTPNNPEVSS